ncbi:DNA recombination protein RmuC, partial [Frankia sp. Cj3]
MDVATTLLLLLGLLLGGAGGFAAGRRAGDIRLAALASERDAATRERELLRQSEQAARERAALAEADVAGMRTALDYERRSATERLNLVEQSQQRLAESFQALSAQALESASRQFLDLASVRLQEAGTRAAGDFEQRRVAVEHLISPLREVLGKMEHRLADLETARIEAYATLVEQVRGVQQVSEGLRTQTAALVTALRKPQTRGAWGEMQLRRVAEVAGMIARCDFTEQPTITDGDGVRRPDMVVHLAGNRNIIVDAKVPLIAFLE